MENDEFDGEVIYKKSVQEISKFSTQPSAIVCCANTIPLLYMTEDIPKDVGFYGRPLENNGMATEWHVLDVCDREITLDARNIRRVL